MALIPSVFWDFGIFFLIIPPHVLGGGDAEGDTRGDTQGDAQGDAQGKIDSRSTSPDLFFFGNPPKSPLATSPQPHPLPPHLLCPPARSLPTPFGVPAAPPHSRPPLCGHGGVILGGVRDAPGAPRSLRCLTPRSYTACTPQHPPLLGEKRLLLGEKRLLLGLGETEKKKTEKPKRATVSRYLSASLSSPFWVFFYLFILFFLIFCIEDPRYEAGGTGAPRWLWHPPAPVFGAVSSWYFGENG